MSLKPSAEAQAFAKYLENRKILIADPGAAARSGLFKVFSDLGAKSSQITLVNSFQQAVDQMAELKPHIVIAEYELGRRCGLDLLQTQREQRPNETKETIFAVVTGNTSQTAVARAAEEDIDAYILKPFTAEVVRKTLMKAALTKIRPPAYLVAIDKGKEALEKGDLEQATIEFEEAKQLDPSPSLACYYLGQVKFLKETLNESKGNYSEGLQHNKIHYKCLVGLYELLMNQKSHSEAYEVVKKISQYFPANPKRLTEVLRLAIINGKYEDVEKYYALFCNIDETRNETLIKYICAALVICGKYYLGANVKSRAMELFQKAAATGTGRIKILKEIVQALLEYNFVKEAKEYLNRFPAEHHKSEEYLVLKILIYAAEGNQPLVIAEGKEVVALGYGDAQLYATLIQCYLDSKVNAAAENLYYQALQKFPDQKSIFEGFKTSIES